MATQSKAQQEKEAADKKAAEAQEQRAQQEQQKREEDQRTDAQKREMEQEGQQGRKPDSDAMNQAEQDDGDRNRIQGEQTGKPHLEPQPGQPSGPGQDGSYPSLGGMKAPVDKDAAPKEPPQGPTTYPAKEPTKQEQDQAQKSQ